MRKSFRKALALTLSASMVFSVPMVNNSEIQAYADGISGDLTVTGFFSAKTNAVAVEDGQTATFTFNNKSNGTKNYENFVFAVTGATGAAYTGAEQEIAIIRADNWGWGGGMSSFVAPDSKDDTKTKLAFTNDIDWNVFPSLMAAGADCEVTFKKEGNTIYYKAKIGSYTVSTTDTSTVDLPSTVYVFFTGENCVLTGFNTSISNPAGEGETTTVVEPETTTSEPETTTVAEPETTTVAVPETTTVAEPETTTVKNDSPNAGDVEEESTTVKNDSPGTGDPEEESTTVKNDSPGTGDIEEETTDNDSPNAGDVEEEPDRIRYNGELDCSGWWVAHTPSVKVGKNGVVYSFVSTTYANATLNWNTPIVVLYTADEEFAGGAGLSGTAGYSEYYVVRSDLYGWVGASKNTNDNPELMPTRVEPSNWSTWLADNKAGVECTVTVKIEDGNAVLTFENGGVKSVSVIPVNTAKPLYFSVSGEKCVLSAEKAQVVEPTGVTVKAKTVTLEEGKTSSIVATVAPANATDKTLTYKSDNTAVATVSATGKITAVKAGKANITVSTVNGKTATVEVTVTAKAPTVVAPTGVSVAAKAVTLEVGKTSAIKATVAPANATNKTLTYKSSNTAVAKVNTKGVITAVKAGTATITVSTANGKTATVTVTVKEKATPVVNPTGVSVKAKTVALEVGKTSQIVATVAPANATNKTLTYTSSKSSVATVSSTGKITAKAAGTATITVKTVNGKTATVVVTVKAAKVANKSIKNVPSSVTLEKGKTLTLKPTVTKGTTDKITYKSSKSKIASVSSKGKISAKKNGSANITVTCGKVKKTVKVKVVNKNTKLTVSKKKVSLKKGKSTTVTAKTSAKTVPVTATSSKTKVAKVTVKSKKITIKAVAKGTAKITVKCGSKKATITVKVK